ncbi:MAG: universal stress protein [Thiobacillus sp.]|nr:universal stress protein [Thiobacillus sp.]
MTAPSDRFEHIPLATDGSEYGDGAIVEAAGQLRADLIVMGRHGRRGFDKLPMGSGSERVLNLSVCPVLVTRS